MNKLHMLAIVIVCCLVFAEGAGLIFFAHKSENLSKSLKELEALKPGYESLSKQEAELRTKHSSLTREYEVVKEELDALRVDRDNLLNKAKSLMTDSGRAKELEETLEELESDKISLEEEREKLAEENIALEERLIELEETQKALMARREDKESEFEKARKYDIIKQLKKEVYSLQQRKVETDESLSDAKARLETVSQEKSLLEAQKKQLRKTLNTLEADYEEATKRYEKDYADAVKKNRELEDKLKNLPKKFSELARQNKSLVKETSQMHYNLGVFYTKNKEYKRAIEEFKKAEEINPNDAYAHFNLGYIYAEYLVNRDKAIEHFRHFLRLAKADDEDAEWVRKYLLTWESFGGKKTLK